jgi:pyrroloquinoline quinone biosynthesis protein E
MYLVAELTGRPCGGSRSDAGRGDELDALAWRGVFEGAAKCGLRRVRLLDARFSGGAPRSQNDLVDLVAHAREAGLAPCLATSGVGLSTRTMRNLWEAGLADIEIAMGDVDAVRADRMAGQRGAFQRRHALAAEAIRLGLPLTVSFVACDDGIGRIAAMVDLALRMKAKRVAVVDARDGEGLAGPCVGAAPTPDQMRHAAHELERLRGIHSGRIVIASRLLDFTVDRNAGRQLLPIHVTVSGEVRLVGADDGQSWNVRDKSFAAIVASWPGLIGEARQRTEVFVDVV